MSETAASRDRSGRARRRWAAAVALVLVASVVACSDDEPEAGSPTTAADTPTTTVAERVEAERPATPATLEGPITVGTLSSPADPRAVDLEAIGYVQEEFFASGTATTFTSDGDPDPDGEWTAEPAGTAPYTTRFVLRRPADPSRFNGTVVVEWLNVSAVEAAPDWTYAHEAIIDAGAAWAGVSVQAFGVVGGTPAIQVGDPQQSAASNGGIRGSNPERYGSLEHPGDQYALDIYSQVGAAFLDPGDVPVVGEAEAERIVAAGESQSAGFLTTYINAIQPMTDLFDGFFVHSRGAGAAMLDGKRAARDSPVGFRFRTDLDVPIMVFETETDVGPRLRYGTARQDDTDLLRVWEVAGTAHADAYLVGGSFPLCPAGINNGPQHYVTEAAVAALFAWIEDGTAPPTSPDIETEDDGVTIVRDEHGNARGGIRTPSVDVPVSTLTGDSPPDAPVLCSLFGGSTPFDQAELRSLHGSRDDYLAAFDAALDEVIDAGFVREVDRAEYRAEAEAVAF